MTLVKQETIELNWSFEIKYKRVFDLFVRFEQEMCHPR
jgi:hypothetical protein